MISIPAQPQFCPTSPPPDNYDHACLWSDAAGAVHQFTPGEGSQGIGGLLDQLKDMVTAPVQSAASGIFDSFGQTMAQAFADVLHATLTWWLGPSGVALKPLLNTLSDPSGRNPAGLMAWLAGVVAVFALIAAGINLMLRRRMDDAVDIGIGLFKLALVYTAGWTVLLGLWNLSDELTNAILGNKGVAELSGPFTAAMTVGFAAQAAPGLMIVLGLLGAILGLFLFFAMLFRIAAIVILAIALPLAAAGSVGSGATKDWLPKVTGWLLAFIMFRPLAALIYSIGLELMTRSDGEDPVMGMFIGFAVIATALVSLGALMKLLSWTTGAAMSGGGGAGLALAGAGAAAGMMLRTPGAAAAQASEGGAPSRGPSGDFGYGGGGPSGAAPAAQAGAAGDPPAPPGDSGGGGGPEAGSGPGGPQGAGDSPDAGAGNQVGRSATPGGGEAAGGGGGAAAGGEAAAGGGAAGAGAAGAGGAGGGAAAAGGPAGIAVLAAVQAANLGKQAVASSANDAASELE